MFQSKQALAQTSLSPDLLTELTNKERQKTHLPSLVPNDLLTVAAYKKANSIISENYFAHTTPLGKPFYQWIQEEKYDYQSAGENLAIAFTDGEEVMAAWMDSTLHRENILDSHFQEIGVAVVTGAFEDEETTVIVQLFGEPVLPFEAASPSAENGQVSIATGRDAVRIATLGAYDSQNEDAGTVPVFQVGPNTFIESGNNYSLVTLLSIFASSLMILYLIERTVKYEKARMAHRRPQTLFDSFSQKNAF